MRLLRRHILDVSLTGTAAALLSLFPFVVVYKNPEALQPSPLRSVFLIAIVVSWPLFILFFIPSMIVYFRLRTSEPGARYLTSSNVSELTAIAVSATMGVLASFCLLIAQAIWVWTASRVGIVWVLALVVLGLALVVINTVSIIAVCVRAIRVKSSGEELSKMSTPAKRCSHPQEVTVLQIDKDIYSPQRVVAAIPKPGSELTF